MEEKNILKNHEDLKKMKFRKNWNTATQVDRDSYYMAYRKHLQEVVSSIWNGNTPEEYRRDFWWVHDCYDAMRKARNSIRHGKSEKYREWLDVYFEVLLQELHEIIEDKKLERVPVLDIQNGTVKGFKYYEKFGKTWIGRKYIKAPKES